MATSARPGTIATAGIDFGTTHSGFAFAFNPSQDKRLSTDITVNKPWSSATDAAQTGCSPKAPTVALIDPDRNLDSFGYEAEDRYARMKHHEIVTGKPIKHRLFRNFKMSLHDKMPLSREMMIKAEDGGDMRAMDVISLILRNLVNLCLVAMRDKCNKHIDVEDVHWAVTVPAIWNDPARQFMREASIKAGIPQENITLTLESEAASVYCLELPAEAVTKTPGSKCMVLDAGGGTTDITTHLVQEGHTYKQLHRSDGGPWGGDNVDAAFRKFLEDIFTKELVDRFYVKYPQEAMALKRDFENQKKKVTARKRPEELATGQQCEQGDVLVRAPYGLRQLYLEHTNKPDTDDVLMTSTDMRWERDNLMLKEETVRRLFRDPVEHIVEKLREIQNDSKVKNVTNLYMVGGFSESAVLQDAVQNAFPKLKRIIPAEAALTVVKGAVLYAQNPHSIAIRISRFSYGIACSNPFRPGIHDETKKIVVDSIERARDVFSTLVKAGDEVERGEEARSYSPTTPDAKELTLSIFCSENNNVEYTTDEGCKFLGNLTVEMPDLQGDKTRRVIVKLILGYPELKVEAMDENTNRVFHAYFNCLT